MMAWFRLMGGLALAMAGILIAVGLLALLAESTAVTYEHGLGLAAGSLAAMLLAAWGASLAKDGVRALRARMW